MSDRLGRIVARVALSFAGLLALALTLGAVIEVRRERRLTDRYDPPGEMVDIGSHRLHFYCEGEGHPPVLLEAGSSLAFSNWDAVQSSLSHVTRTCSYDRSGLGWSEQGPRPPSANQAVEELDRLLESSGISGPWVIVGHSLGGLYGLQFRHLHPEEVAALVLLDSSHEDMFEHVPLLVDRVTPSTLERWAPLGSLVGLHRLSLPEVPESDPSWVARQLHATSKHVRRGAAEWWSMPTSADQVRVARGDLGDTPLLVIQAGKPSYPRSWSESAKSHAMEATTVLQREYASRSTRGRHLILEETGHGIPWERPQAVVSAVEAIVKDLLRSMGSRGADVPLDDSGAATSEPGPDAR